MRMLKWAKNFYTDIIPLMLWYNHLIELLKYLSYRFLNINQLVHFFILFQIAQVYSTIKMSIKELLYTQYTII